MSVPPTHRRLDARHPVRVNRAGRIWAVELNPDDDLPADFDGTN
jgi:hypothetical protein